MKPTHNLKAKLTRQGMDDFVSFPTGFETLLSTEERALYAKLYTRRTL